jgi:hypothetical protein
MGLGATVYCDCLEKGEACAHGPRAELISLRLGNATLIELIHELLSRTSERFGILVTRVVYNGVHSGDSILPNEVDALAAELDSLSTVHVAEEDDEQLLRTFQNQLQSLVQASRQVRKPIAFV